MELSISLTDAARAKLGDFIAAEPGLGLRVYVTSGGCSGFRYGMMLEDAPRTDDVQTIVEGIVVYVDPASAELVGGSTIDYIDALMGAGFTVSNPNAVAGCACGSSFRTAGEAGAPGACGR
jgi:iron-sulfur cluster assembly protein